MTDLPDIIARLEKATGPDRELDARVWRAATGGEYLITSRSGPIANDRSTIPPYTASVDAALTLVPEGWFCSMKRYSDGWYVAIAAHSLADVRYEGVQLPLAIGICRAAVASLKARTA